MKINMRVGDGGGIEFTLEEWDAVDIIALFVNTGRGALVGTSTTGQEMTISEQVATYAGAVTALERGRYKVSVEQASETASRIVEALSVQMSEDYHAGLDSWKWDKIGMVDVVHFTPGEVVVANVIKHVWRDNLGEDPSADLEFIYAAASVETGLTVEEVKEAWMKFEAVLDMALLFGEGLTVVTA